MSSGVHGQVTLRRAPAQPMISDQAELSGKSFAELGSQTRAQAANTLAGEGRETLHRTPSTKARWFHRSQNGFFDREKHQRHCCRIGNSGAPVESCPSPGREYRGHLVADGCPRAERRPRKARNRGEVRGEPERPGPCGSGIARSRTSAIQSRANDTARNGKDNRDASARGICGAGAAKDGWSNVLWCRPVARGRSQVGGRRFLGLSGLGRDKSHDWGRRPS